MIIVADTSGLLAALDPEHPQQAEAQAVLDGAGTVIVCPVLLCELDHLGRRVLGPVRAFQAVEDIGRQARHGRVVLPEVSGEHLDSATVLRARYADLDLDLVDALNVLFAAQFGTDAILTFDHRDFRAIRPLTEHAAFRLLPTDPGD